MVRRRYGEARDVPELGGPDTDHAPERDHDRHDVGHDELGGGVSFVGRVQNAAAYHLLGADFPVPLNIPESKRARKTLRQSIQRNFMRIYSPNS